MTLFFGFIHVYGLLIGLGIVTGLLVVNKITRHFSKEESWIEASLPWIVIGGVVGARVYHLATDWQLYRQATLLDVVMVWRGGLGFLGAIFGGIVGLWLWSRRQPGRNIFLYFDLLSFGVPVAQIIGRIGNWVNGELYGLPTHLPWGITVRGQKYHPLFLYESLANLGLFVLLLGLARKKSLVPGKGQYAFFYLFGYVLIRFWLEYLRVETSRWGGPLGIFSIAQWVCLVLMVVTAVLFWVRRHVPKKSFDFSLK